MVGIRLLTAVSLICSAAAFAQTQDDSTSPSNHDTMKSSAVAESESAKMPLAFLDGSSATQKPSVRLSIDQLADPFAPAWKDGKITLKLNDGQITVKLNPDARMAITGLTDDALCYSIRSYVVARDSKNSDSVHPVGYSTCIPASRYRLKAAVARQTMER